MVWAPSKEQTKVRNPQRLWGRLHHKDAQACGTGKHPQRLHPVCSTLLDRSWWGVCEGNGCLNLFDSLPHMHRMLWFNVLLFLFWECMGPCRYLLQALALATITILKTFELIGGSNTRPLCKKKEDTPRTGHQVTKVHPTEICRAELFFHRAFSPRSGLQICGGAQALGEPGQRQWPQWLPPVKVAWVWRGCFTRRKETWKNLCNKNSNQVGRTCHMLIEFMQ